MMATRTMIIDGRTPRARPLEAVLASLLLSLAWGNSAASAAESPVLSFDDALARAATSGPVALVAESEREMATARARQARAWENPSLSVEVENVLGRGPYRDFDAAETTVSLSQPLPLGGGRSGLLRAAQADVAAAEAGAALAAIELRRDLAIAYAEAVAADRRAAIGRERAALGAQTREAVDRRHAAGLESDLQRARVEVETAGMQAEARRAAAAALAHRRALAAHWREETVTAALDDAWFDAAPRMPPGAVLQGAVPPGAVSQGSAAPGHPQLRLAQSRLDQAHAALDAARGARYGGVEATVGARRFADAPGADRAWVLGLAMPLPLWDRNESGIVAARAAVSAAERDAERVSRALAAEREAALAELDAATLEVDALTASGLPAAISAARLAAQGYEAGRLSLIERLDAERALVQSRADLVAARLRLRQAEARLGAVIGEADRGGAPQASSTER
jgi:cobalt-zinc-cadmium efflux system outer membrane protein